MWGLGKAHSCLAGRQATDPGAGSTCGGAGAPGQSIDGWTKPRVRGKQLRGKQSTCLSQKMKKQRLRVRRLTPDLTTPQACRPWAGRREDAWGPAATGQEVNAAGPEGTPLGSTPGGAGVLRRYLCPQDQRHESLKLETNEVSTNLWTDEQGVVHADNGVSVDAAAKGMNPEHVTLWEPSQTSGDTHCGGHFTRGP